jgi:hypothetical protein
MMKQPIKIILTGLAVGLFAISAPLSALAAPAAKVTNGNNDGPGSLRAALMSGATNVVIKKSVGTITVTETLAYTGEKALHISGTGQTIDGSGLTDNFAPILAITAGADLAVSNLAIEGGGGYSRVTNQGGGKGIFVNVPLEREGLVTVRLTKVSVSGVGNHGVHVSDCTLADDCGGGQGGGGAGSMASVDVRLNDVLIDGVGKGKQDADGVRVDERGDGDIIFSATNSTFINVGADGVELDEGDMGSVVLNVRNSTFDGNGDYCVGWDEDGIDDACNDEGDADVDDGFDVDEAGFGSIAGKVINVFVTNNFDEGLDFDEEDAGGFDVSFTNIYAANNEDEGIKLSEEGDGNVGAALNAVTLENNNGDGEETEIESEDSGYVIVSVTGSTIAGELKIEQEEAPPRGTLKVRGSSVDDYDLDDTIDSI